MQELDSSFNQIFTQLGSPHDSDFFYFLIIPFILHDHTFEFFRDLDSREFDNHAVVLEGGEGHDSRDDWTLDASLSASLDVLEEVSSV